MLQLPISTVELFNAPHVRNHGHLQALRSICIFLLTFGALNTAPEWRPRYNPHLRACICHTGKICKTHILVNCLSGVGVRLIYLSKLLPGRLERTTARRITPPEFIWMLVCRSLSTCSLKDSHHHQAFLIARSSQAVEDSTSKCAHRIKPGHTLEQKQPTIAVLTI